MKLFKKFTVSSLIIGLSISSLSAACEISKSPVDRGLLKEIRSSWQGRTVPIVHPKTFKYTDFLDAYSSYDKKMRTMFKEDVCKKNKWSGVANYNLEWNISDKRYSFIATYDMIDYK